MAGAEDEAADPDPLASYCITLESSICIAIAAL
jgi:hypothetical protein